MDNLEKNIIFLDVRNVWEYKEKNIENSILIPLDELPIKAKKFIPNKNEVIYIFCSTGIRSKVAIKLLEEQGYTNIIGGGTLEEAKILKTKNIRVSKAI